MTQTLPPDVAPAFDAALADWTTNGKVARFWNRPVRMFASGMLSWAMFVIAYDIAGMFFRNLFQILRTPFEALLEGALVYGVCAVVAWVGGMALLARLNPIAPRRRRSDLFKIHHQ